MKRSAKSTIDQLRPEYDLTELLKRGIRGKLVISGNVIKVADSSKAKIMDHLGHKATIDPKSGSWDGRIIAASPISLRLATATRITQGSSREIRGGRANIAADGALQG